jgi:hypothetical protein
MTISSTVIADSLSPHGKRITTLQLRYPRFIHSEFMTHRALSRNASSSRAIPVERMIEDIIADTAMPTHWLANKPGMQGGAEIDAFVETPVLVQTNKQLMWGFGEFMREQPDVLMGGIGRDSINQKSAWMDARDYAVGMALAFHKAGYHKQIVNRLLEPFMHINVVCTATEWDNFFHLRDHPDAEPHIADLARAMKASMKESDPVQLNVGEWHLPYSYEEEFYTRSTEERIKISAARCARVSYFTHDGRLTNPEEDIALYDRLVRSDILHASPLEHQAQAADKDTRSGNFIGWIQNRKLHPNENYLGNPLV